MTRVRAGIGYALTEAMDDGHCGLPADEFGPLAARLLGVPDDAVRTALELEPAEGAVVADTVADTPCVFLGGLYQAERAIAERLVDLVAGKLPWPDIDVERSPRTTAPRRRPAGTESAPSSASCPRTPSVPAPQTRPLRKRSATREQEAGIWRLMVHGTEKCASQCRSGDSVLAALDLTADPITRTLAPRHTPTRGVTPATSTARRPRRRHRSTPLGGAGAGAGRQHRLGHPVPVVRLTEVFRQAARSRIVTSAHGINRGLIPDLSAPVSITGTAVTVAAPTATSKRPATGTHRVFRDTDTRRASRAHRPKSRTPANRRRAYRPRKRAPPKKIGHPGTKGRNLASNGARHREVRLSVPERRFRARSTRPDGRPDNANAGAAPHPHARRYSRNFNCPSASSWMTSIS